MDSISNMNKALAYIEQHLDTDDIDYSEVSKIALCSEYHFKKMFTFLSGIGLADYVRRRRLSLAGAELKDKETKIIDVAVKYGYRSNEAFTRAFYALHGFLPSDARKSECKLKSYPMMRFQLTINGGEEMNYRIVEKGEFKIVGIKKRVPIIFNGVNPAIAKMYEQFTPEIIKALKSLSNVEPIGIISASTNFSENRMDEKGELDHYIGVLTSEESVGEFESLKVESGTWAVFESMGPFPETLQKTWGRIYAEWFPSNAYEAIAGPEIVWHESQDTTLPMYRSEIWIPVRAKK
ncbi:AraC family transcriptional regulator [Fusibacter bizertensis]